MEMVKVAAKLEVVEARCRLAVVTLVVPARVVVMAKNPRKSRSIRRPVVDSAVAIVRSAILIDLPRRRAVINDSTVSRQDTVHHVPVDVSKAKVPALIFIGQFLVV